MHIKYYLNRDAINSQNVQLSISEFAEQNAVEMSKWTYAGECFVYNCPERCGKHLGPAFVNEIIKYIHGTYNRKTVQLEVRSFNERAVKCYAKCGFKTIDRIYKETLIGDDDFIVVEYYFKSIIKP